MYDLELRNERRTLKQKLFAIRLAVEQKNTCLSPELKELKAQYEACSAFTSWSDFPERWDVGDPYSIKKNMWGNEVDKRNYEKAFGKPYTEIINKEVEEV